MTREKIIQGLYRGDSRAIKKAIKALEQESCEDAVSRQAMLDAITEIDDNINMDIYTNEVREIIDDLPSVIPARKKEEWISCSEKMPKQNEYIGNVCKYYLVQDEYGDMYVAHYTEKGWRPIESLFFLDDVIAWMPLPEPYKAESEGEVDEL